MVEMRGTSSWNMCWNYDPLLLINFLKMELWCRDMLKFVSNMKNILWSVLFILISAIFGLKHRKYTVTVY